MTRFIHPFTDMGFKRLQQIVDISALSKDERLNYDEAIKKYLN